MSYFFMTRPPSCMNFLCKALINNLLCVLHCRSCVVLETLWLNWNLSLSLIFKWYKKRAYFLDLFLCFNFPSMLHNKFFKNSLICLQHFSLWEKRTSKKYIMESKKRENYKAYSSSSSHWPALHHWTNHLT